MHALDVNVILVPMVHNMLAKLLKTFLKDIYGQLNKAESLSCDTDMSNLLFVQRFFMKRFENCNAEDIFYSLKLSPLLPILVHICLFRSTNYF